ncbi:MAG: N-acetylneuraminate synthase family protein [Clostridium sp.]
MNRFKIGSKFIGEGESTYIVAEIGANHNGDISLAKEMIDGAIECNVDAVKFQTYTSRELLSDFEREILWGTKKTRENIANMFDRISLKREWHDEVFKYARGKGMEVFSTPFSTEGVDFLSSLDVPCFKIAASDVNYTDLLKKVSLTGKPVMLSLGKCSMAEADTSICYLEECGSDMNVLMHCVAQYPSPMDEMNINVIKTLKQMYNEYVIGFSDHSLGTTAALGAVALGAKVVEKHFTIDKGLEGPDHWFSMDINEMKHLVNEVRNLEVAFGSGRKRVLSCEDDERKKSIRSLVLNRDVQAGDVLKRDYMKMVRPGYGISPFDIDKVIGLKVSRELKENTVLTWDCFK